MQSIAGALGAPKTGSKVSRADKKAFEPMPEPKPIPCEFCGALRHYQKFVFGNMTFYSELEPCSCPEGKQAYERGQAEQKARQAAREKEKEEKKLRERINYIIGESGMGERFLRRTFETFKVDEHNRAAHAKALLFVENFEKLLPRKGAPEPGKNGLFICGEPGTGKTHLAAAISNHLIQTGKPVVCMTMIDLLERIRRTFSPGGGVEADVLHLYKTVPLLVIDDMGKEPPTEWAVSTIYNIINSRYEAYLPIIVTTNYDIDALVSRMIPRETKDNTTALATIDRLREMCKGVAMTGGSRRRK